VKKILTVLVIGCALAFGAMSYHFILMDKSIKVLKKADLTFYNTFVDARGAKKITLYFKPALVKAGVKNLLKDVDK